MTVGGMQRSRPTSWDTGEWNTFRDCSAATRRRSVLAAWSWTTCPTGPPSGCVKKGGRKSCLDSMPALPENFEKVVEEHTAGDPMHADVKWTNLTQQQIAAGLDEAGTPVSTSVVRKLLLHFGYKRRKASKVLAMGSHPDSDTQFEKITRLKRQFFRAGEPVISMDTKKKELLGNFARPGELYAQAAVQVYDHDFGGQSRGVVIPHGIYDLARNYGQVTLGTSHDTSQFAIDSLLRWWNQQGSRDYPQAREQLILCDGGGSNGCRTGLFKAELQRFADRT